MTTMKYPNLQYVVSFSGGYINRDTEKSIYSTEGYNVIKKDQEYTPICHGYAHNNNITNGQEALVS